MKVYRIKKAEELPAELPQEEEWRKMDPDCAEDLDYEEIAELNRAAEEAEQAGEDEDELQPITPLRRSWVSMLLALLLIVSFTVWISFDMVGQEINWGFLSDSARLNGDESLTALKQAVVTVESSGGSGSGFNIRPDGLIVTNRHVVEDAGIITVHFPDGQVFTTEEWLNVENVDLALIPLNAADLPSVTLNAAEPRSGESVIFIGNPLGYDWTISQGTVQGMIELEDIPLIYLHGPIHPGSSGSPVFNSESQVIGVIFARLTDEEDAGLAIPVAYLTNNMEENYEQ